MKKSIHKTLAIRLGAVAIIVSAVLGTIVYLNARRDVGEAIVERALQGATHLNVRIARTLDAADPDRAAVQRELVELAAGSLRQRRGHFVVARVYDRMGREIARADDGEYRLIEDVASLMDASSHALPPNEEDRFDVVWIADAPHVWVAIPLANTRGEEAAHIEGVFAVSAAALSDIKMRVFRAILWAIGVVFLTTALIYPLIASLLSRVTRLTASLLDSNLETLQVLGSAVAKRDSDTDVPNYRVTIIAVRLAEAVGLDEDAIRGLIKGAFLHDVGKIGIRDNILLKPGGLTDEEYEVMKGHVRHGVDIVERSEWLDDARDVVSSHHEKFDGSGYGAGLRGDDIPYAARIFAIADVFDALTSKRPYKEPFSFIETMSILEGGRGSHFDPKILDAFAEVAKTAYEEFSGRSDGAPQKELEAIIDRYFSSQILT